VHNYKEDDVAPDNAILGRINKDISSSVSCRGQGIEVPDLEPTALLGDEGFLLLLLRFDAQDVAVFVRKFSDAHFD